jgi:di/tricarboxylate transporter
VVYVALIGWRLLPAARKKAGAGADHFDLADYIAELRVCEDSKIIGRRVRELDDLAEASDIEIIGVIRRGQRLPGLARIAVIEGGDVLVLEADPESLDEALGTMGLEYVSASSSQLKDESLTLMEVVVPESSRLTGRSARALRLLYRYGISLVGVSREGQRFRENVRRLVIQAGDVLLLLGSDERLTDVAGRLQFLPLKDRGQRVIQRDKAWLTVGIFGSAILLASLGLVYLPIALGCVVVILVLLDIVPLRETYDAVEWPVIILLGSMIPIGGALESTGGTGLIAQGIVDLSAGYSPAVVLTLLIVVTMTLSDVMNNTATAVIAAPLAVDIAGRLGVNPDPFLMGVAVAASCAFLTPIGHKNNTLIMGPGGYRFGDYWRMGLPLEILIVVVSVPVILVVWPL